MIHKHLIEIMYYCIIFHDKKNEIFMQTKTTLIEKYLLNAIERGEYMTGQPIPTRNQLAQMFHCSRTIVERAIASLSADGWLESGRGCRTIVRKELRRPTSIKRLNVISQHDCHRSISDVFCSFVADQDYFGIPVRWFPPDRAGIMASELCRQGSALIWMLPRYEDLELLYFLKARKVPILLLNRDYDDFDNIRTDQLGSIRESLSWLREVCHGTIAFLGFQASISRPYQQERIHATYLAAIELGLRLSSDFCRNEKFLNFQSDLENVGMSFFQRMNPVKGIFIQNRELVFPLIMCARNYGLIHGKDYKLLTFDYFPELKNTPGVGMLNQTYSVFREISRTWLKSLNNPDRKPFEYLVKCEFHYC